MKKLHKLTLGAAFTLLALSACDNEALLPDAPQMNEPDNSNACVLVGDDFRWEGNESRTALTIEDNVAKFSWTTGDKVGILPDEGAQVYFTIPEAEALAEGDELTDEQRRKASFDGGAWALKAESNYAAYYPFVEDFYLDRTKVPVDYTGQKQTGNNNAAHLGAYDYMGARPVTTNANGGGVTFDFDHVGALVLLKFTVPEAGTALKSVTLGADDVTFTAEGTYDLTATKEDGFIITLAEGGTSETMTIEIEHTTTQANEEVTVYFMCAPVDLSGKKVNINIAYGEGEETFKLEAEGKNMLAGNGYLMDVRPIIDGTLGGKTTATEEDLASMVELLKSYIENGHTTIIVTGSQPAKLLKDGYLTPVVSLAFVQLTYAYQDENIDSYWGTVDLIYQDVTEIVEYEFYCCDVLKSITLPNVTTVGDRGFWACYYLETLTFGSVVTNITDNSGEVFYTLGYKIGDCNLVLNRGQASAEEEYQPKLETKIWWNTEWKSITLK